MMNEMITIPSGEVSLARPNFGELGHQIEWPDSMVVPPAHMSTTVHVPAFRMSVYPVRIADYVSWFEGLSSGDSRWSTELDQHVRNVITILGARSDAPMVGLSFHEAYQYCVSQGGILPTEAQWLRAATGNGGSGIIYSAEEAQGLKINWGPHLLDQSMELGHDGMQLMRSVFISEQVSPFGIRDTMGNCYEMTRTRPINHHRNRRTLMHVGVFASVLCPAYRLSVTVNQRFDSGKLVRVNVHGFRICAHVP